MGDCRKPLNQLKALWPISRPDEMALAGWDRPVGSPYHVRFVETGLASSLKRRARIVACLAGLRWHTVPAMRVTFHKLTEERLTTWEAVRGERTLVPGTSMALGRGGLPHDLVQMIVEGSVGIEHGFWGSVAAGATFESTGRKGRGQGDR